MKWTPSADVAVSKCGVHTAGINSLRPEGAGTGVDWLHRIECHGNTAAEAIALRDKVLASLVNES